MHEIVSKERLAVRKSEYEDFESECWPKESTWLDFMNKNTRDFVKSLYQKVPDGCSDPESYIWTDSKVYVWNDMNEPACFN